jgi:tetraacyldisaccharide 4'-kinase
MGADPEGAPPSRVLEDLKKTFHGPVLRAAVGPVAGCLGGIAGRAVLAYAGIANPERFFRLLEGFAPSAIARRSFPDHHAFTERDAAALIAEAERTDALLVTTEKDFARLAGMKGARGKLAALSQTLPVAVQFDDRDLVRLQALLDGVLKTGRI